MHYVFVLAADRVVAKHDIFFEPDMVLKTIHHAIYTLHVLKPSQLLEGGITSKCRVLGAFELARKLCLKVFDV